MSYYIHIYKLTQSLKHALQEISDSALHTLLVGVYMYTCSEHFSATCMASRKLYIIYHIIPYNLKCTMCRSTLGQHCPMQHYDQVAS